MSASTRAILLLVQLVIVQVERVARVGHRCIFGHSAIKNVLQKLAEHLAHIRVFVGRRLAALDAPVRELARDVLSPAARDLQHPIWLLKV